MKNILIAISLAFSMAFVGTAFAGDDVHVNNDSNANANANSASDSRSAGLGVASINTTNTTVFPRAPVNTALGVPLVASSDTCMGSSSAGGQGVSFGLSLGTTWTDSDCVIRKDARFLAELGSKHLALSMMCAKESVRNAVARLGNKEQSTICHISDKEKKRAHDFPVVTSVYNYERDEDSD